MNTATWLDLEKRIDAIVRAIPNGARATAKQEAQIARLTGWQESVDAVLLLARILMRADNRDPVEQDDDMSCLGVHWLERDFGGALGKVGLGFYETRPHEVTLFFSQHTLHGRRVAAVLRNPAWHPRLLPVGEAAIEKAYTALIPVQRAARAAASDVTGSAQAKVLDALAEFSQAFGDALEPIEGATWNAPPAEGTLVDFHFVENVWQEEAS